MEGGGMHNTEAPKMYVMCGCALLFAALFWRQSGTLVYVAPFVSNTHSGEKTSKKPHPGLF